MKTRKDYGERACKITVHGTVQHVGFRHRARWQAEEHGLAGYAKNAKDGTVVIHLEGLAYRIDYFMEWLRSDEHGFEVRRVYRVPAPKKQPIGFILV